MEDQLARMTDAIVAIGSAASDGFAALAMRGRLARAVASAAIFDHGTGGIERQNIDFADAVALRACPRDIIVQADMLVGVGNRCRHRGRSDTG